MVLASLLRVLAIAAVIFFITRWLRRALAGGTQGKRSPSGKPWWDDPSTKGPEKPRLKTLQFRRDPYEVLGLQKGASRAAIDEARDGLLQQNSPEAVAGMSAEIQALAERKTQEIEEAYAALTKEDS